MSTSAAIMSTSDPPVPGAVPSPAPEFSIDPGALAGEIAKMASQLFGAMPGSVPQGVGAAPAQPASPSMLTLPPAPPGSASAFGAGGPGFLAPPNPGPSAMAPGISGISTAASAPPFPGFVQQP